MKALLLWQLRQFPAEFNTIPLFIRCQDEGIYAEKIAHFFVDSVLFCCCCCCFNRSFVFIEFNKTTRHMYGDCVNTEKKKEKKRKKERKKERNEKDREYKTITVRTMHHNL